MYCYDALSIGIYETLRFGLFSAEVPALIYYSHITAVVVAAVLSLFIILNNRTLPARILFVMTVLFGLLSIIDILLRTQIDSRIIMFLWSWWPFLFVTICLLSLYFLYTFTAKKDVGFMTKLVSGLGLLAALFLSVSDLSLQSFDLYNCNAVEGFWAWNAFYGTSFILFLFAIGYGIRAVLRARDKSDRKQAIFATVGTACFLFFFTAAAYVATIANLLGSEPEIFELEQYGYFGMTIFIAFLTYIIVQYHAFNLGLVAAQALVIALIIIIGSQLTFVRTLTNQVLTGVALVLTGTLGVVLIRSVKREIEQRKRIEKLARELEKANDRQVILIHFISHQIKGFVSKSRNIFSMLLEGDYGPVAPETRPILEEGLRSDTQGVNTIQEILNASNIKSGKVTYNMQPFDLKMLIDEIAGALRENAEKKGLVYKIETGTEPLTITGDQAQLVNAFKNLIDNSIKYTPSGEVAVSLTKQDGTVRFEVKDTGVGITQEDMLCLFTEGGHGKESAKVNVESTGFGLYIVKSIIEAHKGRVWAESEGAGKGSRFIVELPG